MIWVIVITGIILIPLELLKLGVAMLMLPLAFLPNERLKRYIKNQFISIDQSVNVICGGSTDETISSRVHKAQHTNIVALWLVKFLNFIEHNHTGKSLETNIVDDSVI